MSRQATADVFAPRERASASVQGAVQRTATPKTTANAERTTAQLQYSLAEQQQLFLSAITAPEEDESASELQSAACLVKPSATLTEVQRLEIYRSGYHARLIECLLDDYPSLRTALGEPEFDTLCRGYIARHPSRGPSLNVFGRHMSEYCRSLDNEHACFLAELAALEWSIVEAIHAPGGSILKPEDLGGIAPEAWPGLKLVVNPALRMLRTDYPVNAYFQALRAGQAPSIPAPKASVVAVYRTGRSVWRLPLDAGMADLLEMIASGEPLAAATDAIAQALGTDDVDEAASKVTRWFSNAVSSGLFSGVLLPASSDAAPSEEG